MKTLLLTGITFLLFVSTSFTQEEDYSLSAKDVANFIQHMPKIKSELEELAVDNLWADENYTMTNEAAAVKKIDAVVKKHGYEGYSDFVYKISAIAVSFAAVKYDKEIAENQPEIQEALEAIEQNPSLTEEQKEAMLQVYKSGMASANTAFSNVPEGNKKAVSAHLEELEELFDSLD